MIGMTLAAGRGTRMRHLTADRPKPLVRVAGRTLLDHALDRMAESGVTRCVVNVHHFANQVEAHLQTRTGLPALIVSDERESLLETGGGLAKARPYLGDDPVIVSNTDAIFLPDNPAAWTSLFKGFDPMREDARLILVKKDRVSGLNGNGDFHLFEDGRIAPPAKGDQAPYFYTGTQILNPAIVDGAAIEPFSMWRFWNESLEKGRLTGVVFDGRWLHVGDPEGLEAAEAILGKTA